VATSVRGDGIKQLQAHGKWRRFACMLSLLDTIIFAKNDNAGSRGRSGMVVKTLSERVDAVVW